MESIIELYVFATGIVLLVLAGRLYTICNRYDKSIARKKITTVVQYLIIYHLMWVYVVAVQYYKDL
jgi:hypothetical protein